MTGYTVVVKKGKKALVTRAVGGTTTSVTIKKRKLATGELKVYVSATNRVGAGPTVTKKFRVR